MSTSSSIRDNYIRIGDYVTLKFLKNQSYLSAEGILIEEVGVSSSLRFFEEHLFQIYVQRQYSATNELEEFSKHYPEDFDFSEQDPATVNHFEALLKGKENETKMNLNVMKNKTGNLLCFGDTIQLLHVKSRKFIQVNLTTARDERENMQVSLNSDGNVMSWIKLLPRYKIDKEGDLITNNTELVLKVSERSNEYLHCADRNPTRGKNREVNSSLEQTPWRINVFKRSDDAQKTSLLMTGDLVYIRDPESLSMISPIAKPINLENKRMDRLKSSTPVTPKSANGDNPWNLPMIRSAAESYDAHDGDDDLCRDDISVSTMDEFCSDHGDVVLQPMEEDNLSTDALWMMESKSITKGGILKYRVDTVHFRHFNTGKYLAFVPKSAAGDAFVMTMVNEPNETETLFFVLEIHSNEELLGNAKAVQIKHAFHGVFIERGPFNNNYQLHSCKSTRKNNKAVNVIVNRYIQKEKFSIAKHNEDSIGEVLDIYFARAVLHTIVRFIKNTSIPMNSNTSEISIWPKMAVNDRNLFSIVIARAALFVQGYPTSLDQQNLSNYKTEAYVITRRQNIFREQGLLQEILLLLDILQPISDWVVSDASANKLVKGGFLEVGRVVVSECLNLLYDLIKGNIRNQKYIADHLLVILAHVSSDRMAAKVAQELLSSNRELQETKISFKEIRTFAQKMRDIPMNSMYLQLLQTCCSCMEEGVPKNQDLVNKVLFGEYADIMLKAHFHENTRSIGDWSLGSRAYELYIGGMTSIRGVDILQNGIAAVSIQWRSNTNRYDPIKLFGKVEVPISEVFRLEKKFLRNNKAAQSAMITTMEYKRAVGDFFVSQLLLCSEMCLGRNYPVMQKLEKLYSFDMLFSMLKMTHSDILKSAATSLLLTLYVDRDPQKVIQLPRLTRTWTEVSTMTVVDIVSVPQNSMHTFGLLQYTISEHLRGIKGRQYPRHTYNTLRLLMKLIDFNFYGSVARMTETIELLVSNLKRDDYDLEVDSEVSGVFTSVMKLVNSVTSRKAPSLRRSILSSKSLLSEPGVLARAQSAFIAIDSFQDESTSAKSIKEFLGLDMQIDTHILHILESSDATMFMVVLTLISLAIDTFSYVSGVYHVGIRIFQFFVLFVYVFEFLLHFCLHLMVRRRVSDFFTNVNTWIDLVNVTLYGIVFILLKLVPFVQTVRLLRLPSFGVQYYQHRRQEKEALSQKTLGCSWVEPDRYFKTSEITISSIIKIVQTLNVIQSNIEDYYLSLLLKEFMRWYKDPKSTAADVFDIFQSVVGRSTELSVSNAEWDGIYIDLLMYSSATLVQKTLSLLMIHHSSLQLFSKNISKLQLITTSAGEAQYFKMERLLNRLKQEAETHDIWGHLLTEEHRKISDEIHEYLQVLTSDCKKRREILTFDEAEEPVVATQNILRNLGCFDVCMKIVQLIGSINHNDTLNEAHINTRKLAKSCNNLLYWFIHDNPSNQELAFKHLGFFIKSIDENIDSHKVISAIFQNNIELIEGVPKKHIADFVSLICSNGRFPQYLSLLNSIITVGEKNVIANQYEVIRLLSSPENQKKVVQYFVPVKHPEYAKKVRSMLPYMNSKDLSVDELPSDLAYHLELMRLLNGCTVGRSGMTTIEAKVQSMFFFVDVIEAMLDTNCLLLAKIRLGQYLYNAMIDVETYLPGFKDADCTWKLLYTFPDVFLFAKDELRQIEKNGWEAQTSNRQKIEYVLVCAVIVSGYFSEYYDHTIFKQEVGQITFGVERVAIKEAQANELIKSLFLKISAIYEMVSPLLAREHHEILFQALVVLNEKASQSIVAEVEKIHDEYMNLTNTDLIHDPEQEAAEKFLEFSAALNSDQRVKELVDKQLQSFIERLEEIPSKTVTSMSNVRFEPLIEKLVMHIRRSVRVVMHGDDTIKSMSPESTKTSVWLVKIFRTMVENRWGMDIYGRDDDGGEEEDNAVVELMKVFSASGMTEMCLDIIAKGIDMNLQAEAIKLLVALLFKEGGAIEVQKIINSHLSKTGSEMFFLNVRHILNNLIAWHKWNGIVVLEEGVEPELQDEIILVRCLQLFCEGHFGPNQDILREQPNNSVSINLLDDFVAYLQALDALKCRTSTAAQLKVAATILEVIQGPCEGNQDYFALNTELIETLNKMIRQRPVHDCDEDEETDLKKSAIEIFQGLLEGQGSKTAIYERMLSVIHIDVIQVLACGLTETSDKEESEDSIALKTESLVLLQMLTDFRPSLKKELGLDTDDSDGINDDTVACVEVVWRGELQRRFFHVPDICSALAKSTKDNFVQNVKRTSQEDKLYGLLEASKEMYREILHQNTLKNYKVDMIFSRTNIVRITWISFYVVVLVNILFVIGYSSPRDTCTVDVKEGCGVVTLDPSIKPVVNALILLLIVLSFFTLTLYLVVGVPLNYRTHQEKGLGFMKCVLYTALDPYVLYYIICMGVAVSGYFYHALITLLTLDFVSKSPTARGVLRAVWNPRKQLIMTLILTMIIVYIFSMFLFYFFGNEDNVEDLNNVKSLENAFKFLMRSGLPYGSAEDFLEATIEYRMIFDVTFFLSVQIMLNIIKGITIDTFVDLRKSLEKRLDDTTEKCFICGIEKNTFNRTLDRNAFRNHIKYDQCLWSYIYFIIYIWEQSKDDDDGLESYVRRCIDQSDLIWFPMNKAVRLAEHLKKGDVHSLKYKFRKDIEAAEQHINMKMAVFKDQLSRSINRVEKAIDFEPELDKKGRTVLNTRRGGAGGRNSFSRTMKASTMSKILDENFETPKSTPSDAVTPFEDPDAVTPFVNPLGADQLGQLHVKLVSISGIVVDPEHLNRLSVRVRTDMQTAFVDPLPLSVEDGSSYIRKDESADHSSGGKASRKSATHNFSTRRDCDINQSLLRFDVVGTSPILVHQGSLPSADLSNLVVKIQLLYGIGEYRRFIGGLNISLVDLLSRSDAGGIMEAEFAISRFEIIERGDKEMSLRDLDVNGSGNFIEENPNCIATVSCIASPKILEEWAEVSKFWSNYKK